MDLTLEEYITYHFHGVLVIGDLHADYQAFSRAVKYAKEENFFLMSLGDLVDRGRQPFEVISEMHELVLDGRAGLTVGNHDLKFCRLAKGEKVNLAADPLQTLEDVGAERRDDFLSMYTTIAEKVPFSGFVHKFHDIALVHASNHKSVWENDVTEYGKSAQSRFLFGQTVNEIDEDGYPVRLYDWIEEIPSGKTLIVGHDRKPVHNVAITEPLVITNKVNGTAVFLDTGCGKSGFLSGAVLMTDKTKKYKISSYVDFK